MRQIVLNRQKFGLEDLAFGTGTEEQLRAGMLVTITKINAGNLPFDETRSLIEWAQDSNIEELGAITAELVSLNNNLGTLNSLAASLTGLNTISSNMSELLLFNDNALAVHNDKLTVASDKNIVAADKALVNTMKLAVENIYDAFDDRFLGVKATDPTLDNDGNALANGSIYFNSSSSVLKVYSISTTIWYAIPQLYLSSLLDIQLTSLTTGDILTWNGTKWVNTTIDTKINLHGRTEKTTLVGADEILLANSGSSWSVVRASITNIKNFMASFFANRVAITVDNTVYRADGTTGNLQASGVTIDDSNVLNASGLSIAGSRLSTGKRKQYLINGNFDSWQFQAGGLTYPQTSTGFGSDDMWANVNLGSTKEHSLAYCTDAERDQFKVINLSKTVVTSVAGSGNYVNKYQTIENIMELAGKTVSISFLAKADSNKNIAIELGQTFGTGGTPSNNIDTAKQLIALTPILTKYTLTVTFPSITGKTLGTNGLGTTGSYINFWFDAGSNFNSRASNLGQQSGTFYIGEVRIEDGNIATDGWSYYDGKFGAEVIAKLRYLEIVEGQPIQGQSGIYDTSNLLVEFNYKVRKRVSPSISNIVPANTLTLARISEKHAVAKCINADATNTVILVNANF